MASFDPARDGFGFRNPVGEVPRRTGPKMLFRPLDSFLYGNGLCFGMAAAALHSFEAGLVRTPVHDLPPTPELLEFLRGYHARQLRPRVVLATVLDWIASGGGKAGGLLARIRLPGDGDPHILNFGPAANRRFFRCLHRAHAVVPHRVDRAGGGSPLRLRPESSGGPGAVRFVPRRRVLVRRVSVGGGMGDHAPAALRRHRVAVEHHRTSRYVGGCSLHLGFRPFVLFPARVTRDGNETEGERGSRWMRAKGRPVPGTSTTTS